ncbi:MAG: hypothetical protein HWN65_02545 [Candidatus Helarchaeota archaeon]|nr:hypothetical protein [Candidatus Helarchaeota archaeon]
MGLKRKLMNMMMPKEFGFISGLFHAGIFTMQSNIVETLGKIGYRDYIFPAIKESIVKTESLGIAPIVGENVEDFGDRFIKVLKKSMLVENAVLTKKSEASYIFSLKKCFMARAAHQVAGTKGVCPMAMVMAAMIEKYTEKEVTVEYSNLTRNGSVTGITVS